MMGVLEAVANFFYDPYVFWGLPLLLAVVREAAMRPRPPGSGPEFPGGEAG
ncbi:MAG: hypothetical protein V3S64_16815 [bacterium]